MLKQAQSGQAARSFFVIFLLIMVYVHLVRAGVKEVSGFNALSIDR